MNREARWWIGGLVALGAFVAFMLFVGNLGPPRAEVAPYTVDQVLASGAPADRFGDDELQLTGWYAELDAECQGDEGGADASVAWLQRECPLRVLMPDQPEEDVTQEELLAEGVVLAAPPGSGAFPARSQPTGPNLRGQQLVFVGHFADEAAEACVPERRERCRNTFVVSDYDEQVR